MTARLIKGNKQEIAEKVAALEGEVREAIVFIEEPADVSRPPVPETGEDMFAEMEPYMANAGDVDYSRDAIYSRQSGE